MSTFWREVGLSLLGLLLFTSGFGGFGLGVAGLVFGIPVFVAAAVALMIVFLFMTFMLT